MERKLFGHRLKKRSEIDRVPGKPYNSLAYDEGREDEESYKYSEEKDFPSHGNERSTRFEKDKDGPPGYEGKEHLKYKNPGYSPHHISYPKDEPHMKSHVTQDEEHEAEDDYHMKAPNQTKYELEKHLKRAHMLMDAPDQQDAKPLRGNITHNVPYKGEEDTSGEEEEGPNDMQSDKEHRKKMMVAVMRKKMAKKGMS